MAEHLKVVAKVAEPDRAEPCSAATARHELLEGRPKVQALATAARMLNARPALAVQRATAETLSRRPATGPRPIRREVSPAQPNRTGMPNGLKAGVEAISGMSMGDVRVHRSSTEPAKLGALAYAQGSDIHLGPGQERHLPHEAWHVVQQKQGRVRPTLQNNGMAINDQPALEREADEMGRTAATTAAAPDDALSNVPPHGDAVQRRVLHGNGEVAVPSELEGRNGVFEEYALKPENFLIRDDSLQALGGAEIHLLEEKVYLLGEVHGDGSWKARTNLWNAPKMKEGIREIPQEAPVPRPEADPEGQALESAHAFALAIALSAVEEIRGVAGRKKCWQEGRMMGDVANSIHKSSFGEDARQLRLISDAYLQFIKSYDQTPGEKPDGAQKVYEFSQLITRHSVELSELSWAFGEAQTCMEKVVEVTNQDIFTRGWDWVTGESGIENKMAVLYLGKIVDSAPLFEEIATSLVDLMGLAGAEKAAIDDLIQNAEFRQNPLTAANPARERAMVANITAAGPPLLVQIGNAHVATVADALGDGVVGVKKGDSFDAVTIRKAADQER